MAWCGPLISVVSNDHSRWYRTRPRTATQTTVRRSLVLIWNHDSTFVHRGVDAGL